MNKDPLQTEVIKESVLYLGNQEDLWYHFLSYPIQAIITDPPYGIGLKYGDFKETFEWWEDLMNKFIPACLELSVPTMIFAASPPKYMNVFLKYNPERALIWNPKFTLSHTGSKGIFFRYHFIWCWNLLKQSEIYFDVLEDSCEGHHEWSHGGTKPESLMRKLVAASGADCILDPFIVSGTTGVVCHQLGKRIIGSDNWKYSFDTACKRIAEASFQPWKYSKDRINLFEGE